MMKTPNEITEWERKCVGNTEKQNVLYFQLLEKYILNYTWFCFQKCQNKEHNYKLETWASMVGKK